MGGYIHRQVEMWEDVEISMKEIIKEVDEKDAKELIIGLLKKYPTLIDRTLLHIQTKKLFPKLLKKELIAKSKKENKPLENYL